MGSVALHGAIALGASCSSPRSPGSPPAIYLPPVVSTRRCSEYAARSFFRQEWGNGPDILNAFFIGREAPDVGKALVPSASGTYVNTLQSHCIAAR